MIFILFFLFVLPNQALASQWNPLVERLAADGFSRSALTELFDRSEAAFEPAIMIHKMKTLYKTKYGTQWVRRLQKRLAQLGYKPGGADGKTGPKTRRAVRWFQKAHDLPVDGRPTKTLLRVALKETKHAPRHMRVPKPRGGPLVYRTIMNSERLREARIFHKANRRLLNRLERHYGVPGEVAVGILAVETRLGQYLGEKSAFLTLASMALCDDYGCIKEGLKGEHITRGRKRWLEKRTRQKARWAYNELKALIKYTNGANLDPLAIPGSLYGAIGIAQFMPTKALRYGADGNGDGLVNLFELEDAVFSMGRYLRANGWRGSMRSRRKQRRAIYNYNHSTIYVNTVLAVADYLREGETVFDWDENR